MQKTRFIFQTGFLVASLVLLVRNLLGLTKATIESYCPGGGLESLYFYLKTNSFICATSGINLIMFLALAGGALLFGRAFCSWVCPIGAIVELLTFAGKRTGIAYNTVWKGKAGWLRFLKVILLGVFLVWTYRVLDLAFRPFCPLYVVLSGQDHEIEWWSKWLMLAIGLVTLFLPFFWCKVLCPLGGFLSVWKKLSPLSPVVHAGECIDCGKCERACPQQIAILAEKRVRSGECTQCLACVDSCPKSCLGLSLGYSAPAVPVADAAQAPGMRFLTPVIIPLGVALMMGGGLAAAMNYPLPTVRTQFPGFTGGSEKKAITLVVKGLRCRGQGNTFGKILETDPGVFSMEVYVTEQKAIVLIDPSLTSVSQITDTINRGLDIVDKKTGKKRTSKPFTVEKVH